MIQISAMENPFQFGCELGAEELVDREDEIAQVSATIHDGGKLFLIGPRRNGKTSILKAAADRLSVEGAVLLMRYDAEGYPSLDLLVAALVAGAAARLRVGSSGRASRRTHSRGTGPGGDSASPADWVCLCRVQDTPADGHDHGRHQTLLPLGSSPLHWPPTARPVQRIPPAAIRGEWLQSAWGQWE